MTLLLALAALLPSSASADVIRCRFTEPFLGVDYSMARQSLVKNDYSRGMHTTDNNISFQIRGPGQFELWNERKEIVMKLRLDRKGSDGMSDTVYPYSAELVGYFGDSSHFGGCSSNLLPAKNRSGSSPSPEEPAPGPGPGRVTPEEE